MELLTITDRCINLLKEINAGLGEYAYKFNGNDELADVIKTADNKGEAIRQFYKDKTGRDIFSTDDAAIRSVFDKDAIFRRLAYIKALTFYVLSPLVELADNSEQLAFAKSDSEGDPYQENIIYTVELFGGPIYVKDLEDEFMRVCPDADSIGKYLVIARAKYSDIQLPYRKGCKMEDFVFKDNSYSSHIRQAESVGIITKQEAETILVSIWQVIDRVNTIADWIVEMYDRIDSIAFAISSDNISEIKQAPVPTSTYSHFSVSRSYEEMQRILTGLQQQGFVSTDTTVDTFYYRMTGNGKPIQGRIIWTKKGRNKAINLISLIDFVVAIGVSLEDSLQGIDKVFCRENGRDIKLPDATKTLARKKHKKNDISADHAAIRAIIDEE